MLKSVFLSVLLINLSFLGHGQSFEFWNAYGAKYKVNKQLSISANFTNRIGNGAVSSFFPEVSARYKIFDWLGVSVDYRLVSKRAINGNYLGANRCNFNLKLRNAHELDAAIKLDHRFNSNNNGNKLIFALSYTANLKKLLKGSTKKGL